MTTASGTVYLVGAGPGDPGLITRRGAELLGLADVVVYDGLVNPILLDLVSDEAERIYAGKKRAAGGAPMTQDAINHLLVERASAGRRVVRLKGGDPFVFGRGPDECRALVAAGIRFEIVPGVTSAIGATAYAGIPLTARGASSTVAFATGHEAAGKPSSDIDWQGLARAGTVVLFMAWRTVDECCAQLIAAGRAPDTPAAAIYWGTTAAQRTAVATLRDLSEVVATAQLRPPVLLVIGEVVALRPSLAWYETRPLFGARALVTRNPEQAQTFVRAVAELGGETVVAPVTRIAPPPAESAAELDRVIAELDRYHWVLFTSANSVVRFFAELRQRARDSRALGRARIACVGPATARAIERFGITADVVPAHGDAEGLARAVLAAGAEPGAVLLPRAASGRDEAIHVLGAAGFAVDAVAVYQTEPSPAEQPAVAAGLARLRAGTIDIIALFAPSQVRALAQLLGPDAAALIRACRVVAAIGKTTAAALQRIGVAVDVIPSRPDADILVSEIAALCEHRPRSSSSPAAGPASSSPGRGSPVSPAPRRGHSEES